MSITRYIFLNLLLLTGLFWSCEMAEIVEPEVMPEVVEEYPDSVYFLLSAPNPHTRVVYADEFRSEFEREDIVGCFALNLDSNGDYIQADPEGYKPNARYRVAIHSNLETHKDRHFLAPLTVSDELKRDCPHYLFYYPYNENIKTLHDLKNYMHEVLIDQSTRDGYEASDLLWDICEPDGKYVHVEMDHAMANVIVEVATDIIRENDVPVLLDMPVSVPSLNLVTTSLEQMSYTVGDNPNHIKMWEFGKSVSGNYMFRAIIPACHTITSGSLILQLPDPEGNNNVHNYRCQKTFDIKPGRNYHFTITAPPSSEDENETITPPENVGDDDTWVYDVLHPDTREPVGLLCREYLHFQPGHTYSDADTETGVVYSNGVETTKFISSQAWVLYRYKPSGVPDLNTGYVLQFINDVKHRGGAATSEFAYWPLPHTGFYDSVGGLFTPSHGHDWTSTTDGGVTYGIETSEGKEHYMHGGVIEWNGTENRIDWFTLPFPWSDTEPDPDLEEVVTNEEAATQGHVAIDENGVPFLCYHPITDNPPHKIGILTPHNLVDRRVSKNRTVEERMYPLVKIGYNQFWMSRALRTATQIDGTPLVNYNSTDMNNPGLALPSDASDVGAGYVYTATKLSKTEVVDDVPYSYFDPFNQYDADTREEYLISPMYNAWTLEDSGMLPTSAFPSAYYYMPTQESIMNVLTYLGWASGKKLLTRQGRTRCDQYDNYIETEYEALRAGKYTLKDANSFAANICGFDLRAEGYYRKSNLINIGSSGAFHLADENKDDGIHVYIFFLPSYLVFSSWNLGTGPSSQFLCEQVWDVSSKGDCYAPLRFFMKFDGQDDTGGIIVSSLSTKSSGSGRVSYASAPVEKRDVYVGLESVEEDL